MNNAKILEFQEMIAQIQQMAPSEQAKVDTEVRMICTMIGMLTRANNVSPQNLVMIDGAYVLPEDLENFKNYSTIVSLNLNSSVDKGR